MAEEQITLRAEFRDLVSARADQAARAVQRLGRTAQRSDAQMARMARGQAQVRSGMALMSKSVNNVSTAFRPLTSMVRGFGRMASSAFKVGAAGVGILTVALGAVIVKTTSVLQNVQRLGAQMDAVLRSTGGAANVTRKEMDAFSSAMERNHGVTSETVTEGQNLLLTFTKVRNETGAGNDIFNQATKSLVDMSIALGTDTKGAALQLGKALNDPTKGVTALARAGVSFTQQQKDQIKTMQASGDMLGAQKMILSELEVQFGGSAEAFGNTSVGMLSKIKEETGNIFEGLLMYSMPAMDESIATVLSYLQQWADAAPKVGTQIGATVDEWVAWGKAAKNAYLDAGWASSEYKEALGNLPGTTVQAADGIQAVIGRLQAFFATIRDNGGGLDGLLAADTAGSFAAMFPPSLQPIVEGVFDALQNVGIIVRDILVPAFGDAKDVLPLALSPLELIAGALQFAADNASWLQPIITGVIAAFLGFQAAQLAIGAATVAMGLFNMVAGANPIGLVVLVLVALVAALVSAYKNSETFRNIVQAVWEWMQKAAAAVYDFFLTFTPLGMLITKLGGFRGIVEKLKVGFDIIKGAVGGFIDKLKVMKMPAWLSRVIDFAKSGAAKIAGMFGGGGQAVPARLHGGPVAAGKMYLVGEAGPELKVDALGTQLVGQHGPELIVPERHGFIEPAPRTREMLREPAAAGGGRLVENLTINAPGNDANAIAHAVRKQLRDLERDRQERTTRWTQ